MRMKMSPLVWLALAMAFAGQAQACSLSGNSYARFQREPLDALFRRSTFVERVRISDSHVSSCPRWPASRSQDDEWDRYTAAHPDCGQDPFTGSAAPTGQVLERFKGAAGDSISLTTRQGGFSDIRRLALGDEQRLTQRERARAGTRHDWPQFWLQGDVGFDHDQTSSCGGLPFLVDGLTYIVFRDSSGQTIAAEPVARDDDDFLSWIRGRPQDATTLRRFTPQKAFAAISSLALIDITQCPRRSSIRHGYVRARLVRGSPNVIFADRIPVGGVGDTYYLEDWLAFHHLTCRPMRLLVVDISSTPAGLDDQSPHSFSGRVWVPPMAAVVTHATVVMQALFPGVPLEGPERVFVDDAFAWALPSAQIQ